MPKKLEKHELLITISLIVIYILLNSFCMNNFGLTDIRSVLINGVFTSGIIIFIIKNKLLDYYKLTSFPNPKKYLYFIPLLIIASINFWGGINISNSPIEILCHILSMVFIGFLEEIIFRGFLFQMMSKDNLKTAIIVTSITFGVGHIINLLNGADFIPTLIQILYCISAGYLFAIIVVKTNSLWPCIITHILINAFSIFNNINFITTYITPIVLIILPLIYVSYIKKTTP